MEGGGSIANTNTDRQNEPFNAQVEAGVSLTMEKVNMKVLIPV
jgi:hypothetical protein